MFVQVNECDGEFYLTCKWQLLSICQMKHQYSTTFALLASCTKFEANCSYFPPFTAKIILPNYRNWPWLSSGESHVPMRIHFIHFWRFATAPLNSQYDAKQAHFNIRTRNWSGNGRDNSSISWSGSRCTPQANESVAPVAWLPYNDCNTPPTRRKDTCGRNSIGRPRAVCNCSRHSHSVSLTKMPCGVGLTSFALPGIGIFGMLCCRTP